MERYARGCCEVQRVDLGADRNPNARIRSVVRCAGQSLAFAADEKSDALSRRPSRIPRKVDGVLSRRERDESKLFAFQRGEIAMPVAKARVGCQQHRAHRCSDGFPVKRIAARLSEGDARTERRGVAERAAHVVRIRYPFEHEKKARLPDDLFERPLHWALGEREAATVQVEPCNHREVLGIRDINGNVRRQQPGDRVLERTIRGVVDEQRLHTTPGLEEPSNHCASFGHEAVPPAQQLPVGHVPIIRKARIVEPFNANHTHAGTSIMQLPER
jgi:hypothetical protein